MSKPSQFETMTEMAKTSMLRSLFSFDMSCYNDDELIDRISKGQNRAFTELFDRHSEKVMGYAQRLLGQQALAEEISQEVWMKVIKASASYQPGGKFIAWLFTIVRHTALSELRKSKDILSTRDNENIEIESSAQEIDEQLIQKHQISQVQKAIDELPDQQRIALMLSIAEDISYEEIANELNTTVSAVKSLIFRARQRLKEILSQGELP